MAFVGYDGGRVAAERLADHVVVTRSEHIPRIQEAQASAYHVLRELLERLPAVVPPGASARVEGAVQGVGFRPYVHRLAGELGLAGFVLNDERGVLIEVEGERGGLRRFVSGWPPRRHHSPWWSESHRGAAPTGEQGFEILESGRGGEPEAACRPTRHLRGLPSRALRPS